MTVDYPVAFILVSPEQYMLMMVVLLFSLPSTDMNVQRSIPEGSYPLLKMSDDKFFSTIIAISSGLEVEFHGRLDSEVQ